MNTHNPTVFIVDDNPAMSESLQWLFEKVGLPVETFLTGKAFLESYDPERHGCLLVDLRMPEMTGFELQQELLNRHYRIPVIILNGYGSIPMAVRAIKAGAADYITKPFDPDLLVVKIKAIMAADAQRKGSYQQYAKRIALLTTREREIMEQVVAGKLNKQIAYEFGISIKTVELHRAHVMQKMQVKSLAELVRVHILLTQFHH